MKYLPLLDLRLTHDYYGDGRCPDFQVEPSPATQRLLGNYRCMLKTQADGVRILIEVTADLAPLIQWPVGLTLTFHLRLANPEFALFTDLTAISRVAAPLYTDTNAPPGNPVPLALTSREIAYPAAPRLAIGVFADVEVHPPEPQPGAPVRPAAYAIHFQARPARWVYYVIGDSPAANGTPATFSIVDKDPTPVVFGEANRTDLVQHPLPGDAVAQMLAVRYPDLQRLRFVSDLQVPCQQQARKSLQLRLDGNQVGGTLPNPSPRNFATVEITANGAAQQEYALYQVVKYFTHQFATRG